MFHLIYPMACSLAGELSEEQRETLASLCRAAEAELNGRLRPDVTAEDCIDAFVPAAAWTALAHFSGGSDSGVPASFRAGEVSVTYRSAAPAALLDQAERLLAPWLTDGGFAFRGVRG